MVSSKIIGYSLTTVIILSLAMFFLFQNEGSLSEGTVIATMAPASSELFGAAIDESNSYPEGSMIVALQTDPSEKKPKILTGDFYAARSPEISFSGYQMVFSGQKREGGLWQIFIMDLRSLEVAPVTNCEVNCTDPSWLPDGRIVFSRLNDEPPVGQMHVIYACEQDGSNLERLTFQPSTSLASSVLSDGRLVVQDRQLYPEKGAVKMLAFRTDGTKGELFYAARENEWTFGKARETPDGQVYFIELGDAEAHEGSVIAVSHGRPLGTRTVITSGVKGKFHSVFPVSDEVLLVSYQPEGKSTYGLFTFNPVNGKLGPAIKFDENFNFVEPVIVGNRNSPKKLPKTVDESREKGTLLCHDASLSTLAPGTGTDTNSTKMVQVFGLQGLIGEVAVAEDGSFYIEVDADTPIQFRTLSAAGALLRGPSDWISVRPGERRSCIGCHEDRELAPENRVPDAIYSGLVSLPEGTRGEPIVFSERSR